MSRAQKIDFVPYQDAGGLIFRVHSIVRCTHANLEHLEMKYRVDLSLIHI